jgi:hypothetical protein
MEVCILNTLKEAHPYVSENATIEAHTSPYRHIVIRNLLKEKPYNEMCHSAKDVLKQSSPSFKYHGGVTYSACMATLTPENMKDGYDFFGSPEWKNCVSKLFNIQFNKLIMLSAHHHTAPSKSGWVHADLSICSYNDDENRSIIIGPNGANYIDDTANRQPKSTKCVRRVACLYYFNNKEDITEQDGGSTAIYDASGKKMVKKVIPENNSVLLFEISPTSYHTYVGATFDRTALVHWFHSSISQYVYDNRDTLDTNNIPFERWIPAEMIFDYKREEDYKKLFELK